MLSRKNTSQIIQNTSQSRRNSSQTTLSTSQSKRNSSQTTQNTTQLKKSTSLIIQATTQSKRNTSQISQNHSLSRKNLSQASDINGKIIMLLMITTMTITNHLDIERMTTLMMSKITTLASTSVVMLGNLKLITNHSPKVTGVNKSTLSILTKKNTSYTNKTMKSHLLKSINISLHTRMFIMTIIAMEAHTNTISRGILDLIILI